MMPAMMAARPRRRSPPGLAVPPRDRAHCGGMKGDRVEIVVDAGDTVRTYHIECTRAGRRVEVSTGRGVVEVSELTRAGRPVRTARFMASRVIALVEHPRPDRPPGEDATPEENRRPA